MKRLFLRKKQRLKTNQEFAKILGQRISVRNKHFILYIAKNDLRFPRLGISVPKSAGNAVERNRLKRHVRETFRNHQYDIAREYDYLVIFYKPRINRSHKNNRGQTTGISSADINKSFMKLASLAAEKQNRNS